MGIEAFSARFELECGRLLGRTVDHVQEFSAEQLAVALELYPVEAVTKFQVKSKDAVGGALDVPDVSYLIRRGCVLALEVPLGSAKQVGMVTYTGGFVTPGNVVGPGQTALPRELEQAAVEQVAFWYQQRARVGLLRYGSSPGYYDAPVDGDLIPAVRAVLAKCRRVWV